MRYDDARRMDCGCTAVALSAGCPIDFIRYTAAANPSVDEPVCVCVHWRRVQHFDVEMAPGRSRVTRRFPVGLSSRLLYFNKVHKFIICTQYFNIVYI